jgi:hypothetical protein
MLTIEKAVVRAPENGMLHNANPRDWQAFVKLVLALEARVKKLEEQLSQA